MNLTKLLPLAFFFTQAVSADTVSLNLTGDPNNLGPFSFDTATEHFDGFNIPLDPFSPVILNQGDIIEATVTLSQSLSVPASMLRTGFTLSLGGINFPFISTNGHGTFNFFNANNPVLSSSGDLTSFADGEILPSRDLYSPDNVAFNFDQIKISYTITDLPQASEVDSASLTYYLVSPVPLPGAFWMLSSAMLAFTWFRRKV